MWKCRCYSCLGHAIGLSRIYIRYNRSFELNTKSFRVLINHQLQPTLSPISYANMLLYKFVTKAH